MASNLCARHASLGPLEGRAGKWVSKPTPYAVGDEAKAKRFAGRMEERFTTCRQAGGTAPGGRLTVADFAKRWIEERRGRVRTVADEEGRLKLHILPVLGSLRLDEVRPRHVIELVNRLRGAVDGLAPKTILNVYGILRAMFRDAKIAELCESNPCELARHHLPRAEDKDPEWRSTAVFARDELEKLISDERIPPDRRVLYALQGHAALRLGEASGLRWRRHRHDRGAAREAHDRDVLRHGQNKDRARAGDACSPDARRHSRGMEAFRLGEHVRSGADRR